MQRPWAAVVVNNRALDRAAERRASDAWLTIFELERRVAEERFDAIVVAVVDGLGQAVYEVGYLAVCRRWIHGHLRSLRSGQVVTGVDRQGLTRDRAAER